MYVLLNVAETKKSSRPVYYYYFPGEIISNTNNLNDAVKFDSYGDAYDAAGYMATHANFDPLEFSIAVLLTEANDLENVK